ncbi:MAG: class I mannose-6-phosphate isomerase [Acidobacteria bacterium]|nr:class I mannose-6-phosphate isomerase [Acidobacteriota bacterium]MBI3663993.1 class I mannose-6-phosphate isomerase [Acidobacteriota bacterium]
MKPVPARIEPQFVPRIWGARTLAPLFPDKTNLAEPIGEAWLTGNACRFATGPYAGRTLEEAWHEMPPGWAGTRVNTGAAFPLLVKFLFPEDILSVQVHPGDDYAREHEAAQSGTGKTEMWYAIAAREGAEVLVGLKPGTTPDSFRRAIAGGTAENCLRRIPLRAGDAVYVPAGTVHTIGPGLTLCEIQENSDLTYRVYDYNRKDAAGKARPLHIEKALAVTNFGEQVGGKLAPCATGRGALTETFLAACRYFATERWDFSTRIGAVTSRDRFELFIFLEGNGHLECGSERLEYGPAQAWLLPAALGAFQLAPAGRTALLRTYVPDIMRDFVNRLHERRIGEEVWSRLVFP